LATGPDHSAAVAKGDRFKHDEMFAADALIFGRVTYEAFAAVWPHVKDEAGYVDRINKLPKYVASSTLTSANWDPSGHTQMVQLSLKGARGEEKTFRPLEVPASYRAGWPEDVEPANVARLYARMGRDLRDGTRTTPSFEDAVAVHRIIAAIEEAAESGSRLVLT
jgi:predicted dehydrogenase